jgi:hypothetical protein
MRRRTRRGNPLSEVFAELIHVETVIGPLGGQELFVVALFDDFSVGQNNNAIGFLNRRETDGR